MNVGGATRRYLPADVTARRKLRRFYSNGEREKNFRLSRRRKREKKRNERTNEKKGRAVRDTFAINPFRYKTFESKGKFCLEGIPRASHLPRALDIVLSQKCLKTGLTGRYAADSPTRKKKPLSGRSGRSCFPRRCSANNIPNSE